MNEALGHRKNPVDSVRVYIAAGLVSGCGALFFNLMPVFVGAMADSFAFDESQLGDVVAAFNVGFTITAISALVWVRRYNWRSVSALGAFGAAAILVAMMLGKGFVAIALLTALLGVAMGSLYALILAVLGDSDNPDRAFGLKLGLETLPGAILLFLLPVVVVPFAGFKGVVIAMAVAAAILGLAGFALPAAGVKSGSAAAVQSSSDAAGTKSKLLPMLSLVASLLFFTGIVATWAFLELIADAKAIPGNEIGIVLSIGFIVAGLGGFAAAAVADRFGRILPMVFICLVNWAGLWALAVFADVTGYGIGTCLFLFTVNFALAYTFGLTAEVDATRRVVVLSAAALSLGAIVGPAVGGRLVEAEGFDAILSFSAACTLFSFVTYLLVSRRYAH